MSEIKFSTTLHPFDLPGSCVVKFTFKEYLWMMEVKKVGSTCWSHIHINDPILDEIEKEMSQFKYLGRVKSDPRYVVCSAYISYRALVKFIERLQLRKNVYDFEGGEAYQK